SMTWLLLSTWGWLTGCQGDPVVNPVDAALAPWPREIGALLERCDAEPFPELALTCRVQAAANLAQQGRTTEVEDVCAAVDEGTWREECHFRAGEELARAGRPGPAISHCVRAGWFARNCLTHATWRLPRDSGLTPNTPVKAVEAAGAEWLSLVEQALAGAPDGLEGEGRDQLISRFGYNLYVGSGSAEPGPAHQQGVLGPAIRTGFGIEAARLLENPSVDAILEIWSGDRQPPTGPTLAEKERIGRYHQPILSPHEAGLPHQPVYGGGIRLVGQDAEEDVTIAALEGLFWLPDTPADAFLPWVDDPRPR
ncbi:MAG: hypothetical protein QGG40_22590, partial [Myxococcota bacterium]|nr:hypothetical protein [Myxococcota bacterium]